MISHALSEEQLLLQKVARDFARHEITPASRRIAVQRDPNPWAVCREIYARGIELGFTRLLIPESFGGAGSRMIDAVILLEELGAADVSIAADLFALNMSMPLIVLAGGSAQQQQEWLSRLSSGSPHLLAGALSEPNVAGSEFFTRDPDPQRGIKTRANRIDGGYVISGAKSAFVTNGGIADTYFVLARTAFDRPLWESLSVFMVPAAAAGLSCSARTRMIGWHSSHHAEVYLDQVRVADNQRLGAEGQAARIMAGLPQMPVALAACFVGLARAAYEYALDYAHKRHSMGVPIVRHQAVGLKLSEMYIALNTARLAVWDAALDCEHDPMRAATLKAPAAKTLAVDVAISNAQKAVEILGAYGVTEEYPVGGWLNDAIIGYSCDFTREMLRLGMVDFLPGPG